MTGASVVHGMGIEPEQGVDPRDATRDGAAVGHDPTRGPVSRIAGLRREYELGGETVYALRGVDLEIARNEYAAIMGPSGSGKSTLMNVLGCLDTPTAGDYWLNGLRVSRMTETPSVDRTQ